MKPLSTWSKACCTLVEILLSDHEAPAISTTPTKWKLLACAGEAAESVSFFSNPSARFLRLSAQLSHLMAVWSILASAWDLWGTR